MMLTHYIILLSSINTLLSQFFASGWLLHHHGFIVAFVSANIIYSIIVTSSSAPFPATPTNINVVVISAVRQVVAGSLLGLQPAAEEANACSRSAAISVPVLQTRDFWDRPTRRISLPATGPS